MSRCLFGIHPGRTSRPCTKFSGAHARTLATLHLHILTFAAVDWGHKNDCPGTPPLYSSLLELQIDARDLCLSLCLTVCTTPQTQRPAQRPAATAMRGPRRAELGEIVPLGASSTQLCGSPPPPSLLNPPPPQTQLLLVPHIHRGTFGALSNRPIGAQPTLRGLVTRASSMVTKLPGNPREACHIRPDLGQDHHLGCAACHPTRPDAGRYFSRPCGPAERCSCFDMACQPSLSISGFQCSSIPPLMLLSVPRSMQPGPGHYDLEGEGLGLGLSARKGIPDTSLSLAKEQAC